MDTKERIVLLDNGSVRAASTLELRRIAAELSRQLSEEVWPVSLQHSDKVSETELSGEAARTWVEFLKEAEGSSVKRLRVIPLFFGPSAAVTRRAPALAREALGGDQKMRLTFGETLANTDGCSDLAEVMLEGVCGILDTIEKTERPIILLVDHGSPNRKVAECRDGVATELRQKLGSKVSRVVACSMERREGAAYDFCDPLLGAALDDLAREGTREVIVCLMFFSPGRHAGPGGDIAEICEQSEFSKKGGRIRFTPLVGALPSLVGLLAKRLPGKQEASSR
ncbi:MAG: CbiX/SirB N-terminal domain-containing protein [Verrucomicrobiota bacterium]